MAASVTVSVEIELGWGFHDIASPSSTPELSDDGEAERDALRRLLNLCDETDVAVSFDVVGHLLLQSCDGDHQGPHPDGWFDRDPGTDLDEDPLFYAPDLVEMISAYDVDHEVCTHTFSHVLCDEIDDQVLDWELERVQELHDEPVVSIVPPRHREPSRNILRDNGIRVVRLSKDDERPIDPIRQFVWSFTRDHPRDEPTVREGVIETRSSPLMTLTSTTLSRGSSAPHLAYRLIPERIRQHRHRDFLLSGLQAAQEEGSHIHYWTHLYNLAHRAQWPPIRELFSSISACIDNGNVEVERMEQLLGGSY